MPKCLECNKELSITDCSDFEFNGTNEIIATMEGICPNCKKEYSWQEIYEFKKIKKLEENA